VRYGIGLFVEGAAGPAAIGWFVHVFVDRATRRAAPIEDAMRQAMETLMVAAPV
jgi:acyl-CoA thioester hydrolase